MSQNQFDTNPFDMIQAADFSDAQILDHWVDISGHNGGLISLLKPRLVRPMLFLGGKGSGKTHLMRYCSAPVQAARFGGSLKKAIDTEKYLGIYVRAEGLNTLKFEGKGLSVDAWSAVFNMYFEIWLATYLLGTLQNYLLEINSKFCQSSFTQRIADLFDTNVDKKFNDIKTLLIYLTEIRKSVDFSVNNAAITGKLANVEILFSPGALIYGIPEIISQHATSLSDTLFVYLIDEAENFTQSQQKFLNTLIRYRKGNATIKVGARLYGIRTYDTLGSGEPIKRDAEYERVELDNFIRDHEVEYRTFAHSLISKRLQAFGVPMARLDKELEGFFEEISPSDFYQIATLDLVKALDRSGSERPYFKKLRTHLKNHFRIDDNCIDQVINHLRIEQYPYLEKVNTFILYKRWPKTPDKLLPITEKIANQSRAFAAKEKDASKEYSQIIAHFSSDILAQLYRECKRRVPYAGLQTLIHLSQGIPRNLLCILQKIYRRSLFAGERPFTGGIISIGAQADGVMDSAAWFWEDAQPESYGQEVREGIEALAILLRTIRYSERPSECDLSTFSIDEDKLSEYSRLILRMAENWSYIIRIRDGRKNKNSQRVDQQFQLAPMLAPKWGISEHRRGSIEIRTDFGNALLDPKERARLPDLFKKRVSATLAPNFGSTDSQDSLFS